MTGSTIRLKPRPSRRIPQRFIEEVVDQECVWGLRHPEGGWALCPSLLDENQDIFLFWSERRLAFSSSQQQWAEFEPVAIELREFILVWLDDMIARGTRIGLDWNPQTDDIEYDTQTFKRRLCNRLNKLKKII